MDSLSDNKPEDTLQYHQVEKLNTAYRMPVEVHGRGNFPTLEVRMHDLVQKVYSKLIEKDVKINDVRINGGLGNYILGDSENNTFTYNDIDLIFSVEFNSKECLLSIKDYVMDCLLTFFPEGINKERLSHAALTDAYISKLAKVWQPDGDKWTLVTLSNDYGMNLELKFVQTMKRKYQFSVDSFQIILDSLMKFDDLSSAEMSEDFFPTVMVESVWGNYEEALYHLNNRLIHTHSPQEIKGGGLLKYCDLLAKGYIPACNLAETETMERLMCSRFFIDYPDTTSQFQKLNSYLVNHFGGNLHFMVQYLEKLYLVVNTSTVCLMGHERREALNLIHRVAYSVRCELDTRHHFLFGGKHMPMYTEYHHQSYYPIQQAVALCNGYSYLQQAF